VEVFVYPQNICSAADNGHCRLDGFGHHFAKLAGVNEFSLARNNGGFDRQQFTTDLRPCETGYLAYLIPVLSLAVTEAAHTKILFHTLWRDEHSFVTWLQQQGLHDLAANLGNLPFEVTNAGLTGVMLDDVANSTLGNGELFGLEAIFFELLRHEVFKRDLGLLILGVTRNANNLHSIEQRRRDVQTVCGANEHRVRQIEIDFEIMIRER
jgi:hypothetical protein